MLFPDKSIYSTSINWAIGNTLIKPITDSKWQEQDYRKKMAACNVSYRLKRSGPILMCKFLEYKSLHALQTKSTIGLWLKVFFQSFFFLQKEAKKSFFETWFANLDGVWGWMHSSLYVKNWTCWYAAHTYTVQTVCQVVDSTA